MSHVRRLWQHSVTPPVSIFPEALRFCPARNSFLCSCSIASNAACMLAVLGREGDAAAGADLSDPAAAGPPVSLDRVLSTSGTRGDGTVREKGEPLPSNSVAGTWIGESLPSGTVLLVGDGGLN
mmetsp:Transcript_75036/g.132658  ORF Transcript_75036/g.132658 Transcript_75036/m.132658 type:complete len:124 (+) Transcript_75036:230-601(+)